MPTEHDIAVRKARQAWMLRVARLTDPREPTQAEVAEAAGLGKGSGSVVSLWERNATKEGPKQSQLMRLAAYYGLPLNVFTEPDHETDAERLADKRRLSIAAVELEQADWNQGGADSRGDEDELDEPPHRPQA